MTRIDRVNRSECRAKESYNSAEKLKIISEKGSSGLKLSGTIEGVSYYVERLAMFKSADGIDPESAIGKTLKLRESQIEQQDLVNAVLKELKEETGAECLRELEFHKISHDPAKTCDDLFMCLPQCHASTLIAGREIKMQEGHDGFLKNLVRLRLMNSLQEMVDLLQYDISKFRVAGCEHKNQEEDGYCHDCESFSEER